MDMTHKNAALAGGNALKQSQVADNYNTTHANQPEAKDTESHSAARLLVTRITSDAPTRLTKRFELDQDGQLVKHPAGKLVSGRAEQVEIQDLSDFLTTLDALSSKQAMTYGIAADYPSACLVTEENRREGSDCISRTRRYFGFRRAPGIMMLDHDAGTRTYSPQELIATLRRLAPSLADVRLLWRASASSGILTADGSELTGLRGQRLYLLVQDAALIPDAGKALVDLCWAHGLGRIEIGRAGQALERTLFDHLVWQPERLDFAAEPTLGPGLKREVPPAFFDGNDGAPFDLRRLLADADQGIVSAAAKARGEAREQRQPQLEQARQNWLDEHAPKLATKRGLSVDEARAVLGEASQRLRLPPSFVLCVQDGTEVTVQELLENREYWHGRRFADPLEPDYHDDHRIAWANLRNGSTPYIYSHAHGGRRFELAYAPQQIVIRKGGRAHAVDEALKLLRQRGELFDYGNAIAHITGEGDLKVVDQHWLLDYLDRVAQFFTFKEKERDLLEVPTDAPTFIAQRIAAKAGERGFPALDAVITAPTLRVDGSLLNEPGFDTGSKLLLAAKTPDLPYIPTAPTQEQAARSLEVLWSPFREFPLVGDVDHGVILAAILTATVRASLPTAPGFGIDAPTAGSGKTLLAQAIGALLLGCKVPALPPAGNQDDETRKRLFAALRDGTKVLLWDNVRDPMGNASLDAFLTAPTFSDRVLGASETLALPNRALFLTTGNSLRLVGDTCRRLLIARIDPAMEKPYAREFDFCPVETVISRRQELVAAALTLMRAYITAGRQRLGSGRTASFEAWDDLVRQTVCWVATWDQRFADPLRATERAYEEDPDTNHLRSLLHAWYDVFGSASVTVEELVQAKDHPHRGLDRDAILHQLENPALSDSKAALREALESVAGDFRGLQTSVNNRVLGKWIAKHKDRRIDGLRIAQYGSANSKSRKSKQWCVLADNGDQTAAETEQRGVWGSTGVDSGSGKIVVDVPAMQCIDQDRAPHPRPNTDRMH